MPAKICAAVLLFAACGTGAAHGADLHFVQQRAGVTHELDIVNLTRDVSGVPSFDYRYRQSGKACSYSVSGKAVAGHEMVDGKLEFDVYSPQDAKGRETAPVLIFYGDDANFSVKLKEMMAPAWITFDTTVKDAVRARTCGKSSRIEVRFRHRAGDGQ